MGACRSTAKKRTGLLRGCKIGLLLITVSALIPSREEGRAVNAPSFPTRRNACAREMLCTQSDEARSYSIGLRYPTIERLRSPRRYPGNRGLGQEHGRMIPSGRLSFTQRIMAEHLRIIAVAPFFGTIPT